MPRQGRIISSTGIYHVMGRGNEKKDIFLCADDKNKFLHILNEKMERDNFMLYAYCVMDNHFHLLIKEEKEDISTIMKRINTAYAYYFNQKYKRVGHVFQDRFKSEPVERDAYLLQVVRYIHRNPIKAGLCNNLFQYPWSSLPQYINQHQRTIAQRKILEMFSMNNNLALKAFLDYMNKDEGYVCLGLDDEIKASKDDRIKNVINGFLLERNKSTSETTISKGLRNELIKTIMEKTDASIRQIAAVLQVDRNVVQRVRPQIKGQSESKGTVPGDSHVKGKVSQKEPSPVTHCRGGLGGV